MCDALNSATKPANPIDMSPAVQSANATVPDGSDDGRSMRYAIEAAVIHVFGVDRDALVQTRRGKQQVAHARQVAMYLAHVTCDLTLTEVGRLFDRDRTTVAHACMQIENRRDDPQFDRALDLLGWAIPAMTERPDRYAFLH